MADRELDLRLIIRADGSLAVRNLNQVDNALENVGDSAQDAGRDLRDMGNQVNQTGGVLGRFTGIARQFAAGLIAAFSVKVIIDFVKGLISLNDEMDDLRDRLGDVTGSAEAAERQFQALQDLAENSPHNVSELTKAYIDLQNFGLVPTSVVMRALTNASADLEDASRGLADLTDILGTAWANNRLSADALLKLVKLGIPALDLMAKATGSSANEILNMAQKGQLGRQAIAQLIVELDKFAGGKNEQKLASIAGRFEQLGETWSRFIDNLIGPKTEGAFKTVSGWFQGLIKLGTDAINGLDLYLNGAVTPRLKEKSLLAEINGLYEQIEQKKQKIAAIQNNGIVGSLVDDFAGNDLALEKNRLDALQKQLSEKIVERSLLLDEARRVEANKQAEFQASITNPPTSPGRPGRDSSLDDAKQQAAAELQIQLDKIARIEQIAAAEFANDLARAEAHAAEKLAQAKGDQAAELAIEQELADAKAAIERNQLEASRSFAEERLRAQLAGKQQELALTKDRGEQAKVQADIVKLEEQIKAARDLSGLAAQKLALDEQAANSQRLQAQQNLVDQVILKYDKQAARMREFDSDAAIVNASNLPLEVKAKLLELIAQRYGEAGKAADEAGDTMSKFAEQGARNIQDAFADFLFDPFQDGLDGMLRGFIDTIRRMTAEALSAEILQALLGKQNKGGNDNKGDDGEAGSFSGGIFSEALNSFLGKSSNKKSGQPAQSGSNGSSSPAPISSVGESSDLFGGFFSGLTEKFQSGFDSVLSGLSSAGSGIGDFFSGFGSLLSDGFSGLISSIGSGLSSAGSSISSFFSTLFAMIGSAAMADGGRVDATSGGRQRGPGTGTSDEIPAWLSNNEHVIKEDSVRKLDAKYGSAFLDFLNQYGEIPQGAKALAIPALKIPTVKFSAGGRVNASAANGRGGATNVDARSRIEMTNINVVDPALVHDAMASAGGTRVLLNVITNNPRAFKQALEL
jgi:tape measure domain-containing protein